MSENWPSVFHRHSRRCGDLGARAAGVHPNALSALQVKPFLVASRGGTSRRHTAERLDRKSEPRLTVPIDYLAADNRSFCDARHILIAVLRLFFGLAKSCLQGCSHGRSGDRRTRRFGPVFHRVAVRLPGDDCAGIRSVVLPRDEKYRRYAREAHEQAQRSRTAANKASWLRIAQSWLDLASHPGAY